MPRISVKLPQEEHQALCDLALREWREVPDQAAFLIVDGLRRRGHVLEAPAAPGSASPTAAAAAAEADHASHEEARDGWEVNGEPAS